MITLSPRQAKALPSMLSELVTKGLAVSKKASMGVTAAFSIINRPVTLQDAITRAPVLLQRAALAVTRLVARL